MTAEHNTGINILDSVTALTVITGLSERVFCCPYYFLNENQLFS